MFFFVQFDGWDNTDQCGKLGKFKAAFGEWTSPILLDTDGRPGGCKVRFAMLDESKLLDDLSIEAALYADDVGGDQCSGGGPHQIPIADNASDIKWTPWLVIDADERPGGCQFAFYLDGRTDVVFDVNFYPEGNALQCGNPGRHTATPQHPVIIRVDTDDRRGGCKLAFRLRAA